MNEDQFNEIIDLICPGADEFQRLALAECLRDVEGVPFPPVTPEDEQRLMRLGAIALTSLKFK